MEAKRSSPYVPQTSKAPSRRGATSTRRPLGETAANSRPPPPTSAKHLKRKQPYSADSLPESDPKKTRTLWAEVAVTKSKSMSERGGGRNGRRGTAQPPSKNTRSAAKAYPLHPRDHDALQSTSVTGTSMNEHEEVESAGMTVTSRSRRLRPQDSRFRPLVLEPCRINIDDTRKPDRGACAHFGTTTPPRGYYRDLPELEKSSVWLQMDAEKSSLMAKHYDFMRRKALCEDEFAAYAKENFFRSEPREINPHEDRHWRPERMLQLVCPAADAVLWSAPPKLSPLADYLDDFKWDLRPDCAYWLSMRGFNPDYAYSVGDCCFVYRDWVTCPYLTIVFKRDDWKTDAVATAQAASAGTMALYNRYRLRKQANESVEEGQHQCTQDLASIRHYAVTFTGAMYVIWILQSSPPSVEAPMQWNGCRMSRLSHGDCTETRAIERLVSWINEIHRWGLTEHARSCEADIKRVLNANQIDTSLIEQ